MCEDLDIDQHAYHDMIRLEAIEDFSQRRSVKRTHRVHALVLRFICNLGGRVRARRERLERAGCRLGMCCVYNWTHTQKFHRYVKCTHSKPGYQCTCTLVPYGTFLVCLLEQ